MALEVIGKLIKKYPALQVKENFKKREFVLEIDEEINGNVYQNFAKMQLVQAKIDILDRFNVGDIVKVSFNIKGNKFQRDGVDNYITNLDAWRIESFNSSNLNLPTKSPTFSQSSETSDDLPF